MADAYTILDNAISTYNTKRTAFTSSRSIVLTDIATSYTSGGNALIFSNQAGTEFWIIFVKTYSYKTAGGYPYDIDIQGPGLRFTLTNATTVASILSGCNSYSGACSIVSRLIEFEFHGDSDRMRIPSVIQCNTVTPEDDKIGLNVMTVAQFTNLCNAIATEPTAMPL